MLDTLTRGFRNARQKLSGMGEFTESNVKEALRDVRMALLEADVDFKVTKTFLDTVKEELLGQEVTLKLKSAKFGQKAVSIGELFIKSCFDQLVDLMGPVDSSIDLPPRGISTIMMVGLQGSGKTTTTAKLARYLEKKHNKKPLLVAADVYRPAAIEQLKVLGNRLGYPVYSDDSKDPPGICERAVEYAKSHGRDLCIFDTAGRLAIDEVLMEELVQIRKRVAPDNIFLVIDAMIGQDAVKTATAFDKKLELAGSILTKLDGDARGGSALSVKAVTGKPIKFLGMGESLDRLEEFRPEGMASRILGMGDVVGLVQDFEEVVDAEKAEKDAEKMLMGKFNMTDFLEQIKAIKKMGSLKDLMEKLPFFPNGLPDEVNLDDSELVKIEAIIHSMTNKERNFPDVLFDVPEKYQNVPKWRKKKGVPMEYNMSRITRIAKGSGRQTQDVMDLLSRFLTMKNLMAQLGQN
ncbi:signal recognition particle protein Srp54, partial [Myxococcota bacterium]|nr:signal recognition particle protein Srp54 [Myxococcota bacterium]